jgi:hypothetical protein
MKLKYVLYLCGLMVIKHFEELMSPAICVDLKRRSHKVDSKMLTKIYRTWPN